MKLHMELRVRATVILLALATGGLSAVAAPLAGPPRSLLDTGLYVTRATNAVHPDNLPFAPQYPLWSDGADKRRWLNLPPGTWIDASRPDAWEFPVGTRLWKEFSREGRRIETRFIQRRADSSWLYATYVWNDQGSDAVLAPADGTVLNGIPGIAGRYEVPRIGQVDAAGLRGYDPDRPSHGPRAQSTSTDAHLGVQELQRRGSRGDLCLSTVGAGGAESGTGAGRAGRASCGHGKLGKGSGVAVPPASPPPSPAGSQDR